MLNVICCNNGDIVILIIFEHPCLKIIFWGINNGISKCGHQVIIKSVFLDDI